jgi:hypothetical protein
MVEPVGMGMRDKDKGQEERVHGAVQVGLRQVKRSLPIENFSRDHLNSVQLHQFYLYLHFEKKRKIEYIKSNKLNSKKKYKNTKNKIKFEQ